MVKIELDDVTADGDDSNDEDHFHPNLMVSEVGFYCFRQLQAQQDDQHAGEYLLHGRKQRGYILDLSGPSEHTLSEQHVEDDNGYDNRQHDQELKGSHRRPLKSP